MLQPITLTVEGAEQFSGIAMSRIKRLAKSGDIEAVKVGGRTLIKRASLEEYLSKAPTAKARTAQ